MRMILRLDADFTGIPGGLPAEERAMAQLYRRLEVVTHDWLPEYGGAHLNIIVGYQDSIEAAQDLVREHWATRT